MRQLHHVDLHVLHMHLHVHTACYMCTCMYVCMYIHVCVRARVHVHVAELSATSPNQLATISRASEVS